MKSGLWVIVAVAAVLVGIAYLTLRFASEPADEPLPPADRGYLGISISFEPAPRAQAARLGVDYLLFVADVIPGSPAASRGIRAGDAIARIDGAPIPFPDETRPLGSAWRPGQIVKLNILRGHVRQDQAEELIVFVPLIEHAALQRLVDQLPKSTSPKTGL